MELIKTNIVIYCRPFAEKFADFVTQKAKSPSLIIQIANMLMVGITLISAAYLFYRLYQFCADVTSYNFPNGIACRGPLKNIKKSLKKSLTQQEVRDLTKELTLLIPLQRIKIERSTLINLFLSVTFPILINLWPSWDQQKNVFVFGQLNFGISVNHYGLFLKIGGQYHSFLATTLCNVAHSAQALTVSRFFYTLWANRQIPKQRAAFLKELNTLSVLAWRMIPGTEKQGLLSTIFVLRPQANVTVDLQEGQRDIPRDLYVRVLQQLFQHNEFSAHLSDEEELLLNFKRNSHRAFAKLKHHLMNILSVISDATHTAEKNTRQLNALAREVKTWEYHLEFNYSRNSATIFYYIEKTHIPAAIHHAYIDHLQTAGCDVVENAQYIAINTIPAELAASFRRVAATTPTVIPQPVTTTASIRKKSARATTAVVAEPITAPVVSPYPERIQFSQNTFFRSAPTTKPDNFAYPLQFPWKPEGRAYACIDLRIIAQLAPWGIVAAQVFALLDRGLVNTEQHNAHGIQPKMQSYKNIAGEKQDSTLQMKFAGTNIGVFGRKIETKTVDTTHYELYQFDGPTLRH